MGSLKLKKILDFKQRKNHSNVNYEKKFGQLFYFDSSDIRIDIRY